MQGKNQLINRTGSFGRPNSKGRKTKTSLVFGNLQPKKKKKRVRKIPQSDTEMFSEPCRKHSKDQWAAADRCWLHGHYSFTMILAHTHGTKPRRAAVPSHKSRRGLRRAFRRAVTGSGWSPERRTVFSESLFPCQHPRLASESLTFASHACPVVF